MVRGLSYSIILHSLLLLLIGIGIPILFDRDTKFEPIAVSVELVPIKDISNLPNINKPVSEKPDRPKAAATKQPPKPVVKETKPDPLPNPIVAPEEPAKPEAKKPEAKKAEKKEEKKKADDPFEQVLKDLTERADEGEKKPKEKEAQSSTKSKSTSYNPSIPLSISEKDAVRSQFAKHWRLPAGVRDDYTLRVEIRVLVNKDGTVKQVGIEKHQANRYRTDRAFRAAADSAIRAVKLASPLKNLPPDKYSSWSDMVVNFDPKDMLY